MARTLGCGGGAVAALATIGWAGLRVRPAPFPPVAPSQAPAATFPLPAGLPGPVERYYRMTYGERVPVITSGVVSGRGTMRIRGIPFPTRFRFMHEAARNFRSYFELTVFGVPVIAVDEHYRDGKFRQELPFGIEEGEPKNDHSADLRMWSEWALWFPTMLLRDPQVRWEPLDDAAAVLVVPSIGREEHLVVRFDEETGALMYAEAMKYKHPTDATKTLWANAVWFGDRPWASFDVEDVMYNVPVDTSLTAKGP
ncbi:MAG: DUF6544 family protein [Anaerolineae bacterium]